MGRLSTLGAVTSGLAVFTVIQQASGCSNILVTHGASNDGSAIYSYSADSAGLYGSLDRLKGRKYIPAGTKKKIYDWDSGVYLGDIDEPSETYDVVGNMNEFQLAIGETTFGGVPQLCKGQKGAKMDYGSLIWTTLQRAKTAREAIKVMDSLVKEYGYVSEGESFSIVDKTEVWMLEMIGKGENNWGAVWTAVRIPDGDVAAHANQARIRNGTEPETKGKYAEVIQSDDVYEFAVSSGLYNASSGVPFSFSDVYDPVTFVGARAGEARVYSFFTQLQGAPFRDKYEKYAGGWDLSNRMPLSVPISNTSEYAGGVTPKNVMKLMRNRFEGLAFDMRYDVGAGPWESAFRDRPLTWHYENEMYINERSVGVQQTAWHLLANVRPSLPDRVGGVIWFGLDDYSFSANVPFYPFATIPIEYRTASPKASKIPGGLREPAFDLASLDVDLNNEELSAGYGADNEQDQLEDTPHSLSVMAEQYSVRPMETASLRTGSNDLTNLFYDDRAGAIDQFSWNSLFWLNNVVANKVYANYANLAPLVKGQIDKIESHFFERQQAEEEKALTMLKRGDTYGASKYLSRMSSLKARALARHWRKLWEYIVTAHRDGVKVLPPLPGHDHGGQKQGGPVGEVIEGSGNGNNEWSDAWKSKIVKERGEWFRIVDGNDGDWTSGPKIYNGSDTAKKSFKNKHDKSSAKVQGPMTTVNVLRSQMLKADYSKVKAVEKKYAYEIYKAKVMVGKNRNVQNVVKVAKQNAQQREQEQEVLDSVSYMNLYV